MENDDQENEGGAGAHAPGPSPEIDSLAAQIKAAAPGNGAEQERPTGTQGTPSGDFLTIEEVRELVTLPADVAYALTRSDVWHLDEREIDILARRTERAAQMLGRINSDYLNIIMMLSGWAIVYGPRWKAYKTEKGKNEARGDPRGDENGRADLRGEKSE